MPNVAILMLAYTLTSNAMNKVTDSTNNDYAQVLEGDQRNRKLVSGNQLLIKVILMLVYTLTLDALNE